MLKLPDVKKMSKREKTMVIIGSAVALLVFADRLVLSPWLVYINKIRSENKKLEKQLVQQTKILSRKDAIMQEVEAYRDYLKAGEPPEVEMANFLREVEKIGRKSELALEEIKPLVTEASDQYQEYGLEIHYSCDLLQCASFIHAIESYPALYLIERALISVDEQNPELLKGTMRIKYLAMKGTGGA